jgi:hypothetical protein
MTSKAVAPFHSTAPGHGTSSETAVQLLVFTQDALGGGPEILIWHSQEIRYGQRAPNLQERARGAQPRREAVRLVQT